MIQAVLGIIVGAVAGSTATALQHRYEKISSFIVGRSECPHCHHTLQWFEIFPIVSWILAGGRCRTCKASIGWATVAIELSFALVGYLAIVQFGVAWWLSALICLFVLFGALVLVDIEDQLLPDVLVLALIPFILFVGWSAPSVVLSALKAIEGVVVAGGIIGLLWLITKGKGIGEGDIKLAAVLGLGLGPALGLMAVMISFMLGGVVAVVLLATGRAKFGQRIAFGPLLVLGYTIVLFAGPAILSWYSY